MTHSTHLYYGATTVEGICCDILKAVAGTLLPMYEIELNTGERLVVFKSELIYIFNS